MKYLWLRIIRGIAIIPFVGLCIAAICNGWHGGTFIHTEVNGAQAVLLTIIMYLYFFWWFWIICIVVIIFTSVVIGKRKKAEFKE